ncbi:MAG: glycosyltransferase family 2 protein, partial [Verrucomicrobia bacterium]
MSPLLSIVIPTLNRANYLQEAIRSCVNQRMADLEIIVVDNASENPTANEHVCSSFKDQRVRYVHFTDRVNHGASWTRAIHQAKGEFSKLLCDDDVLSPDYALTAVTALQKQTQASLFSCAWHRTPDISAIAWGDLQGSECWWIPPGVVRVLSYLDMVGGGLPTLACFRTDQLLRINPPFDSEAYLDACDSGCWQQLIRHGGLIMHRAKLAGERLHPTQTQKQWTLEHYRAVFTRLKVAAWEVLTESERRGLPDPKSYVRALDLLMR